MADKTKKKNIMAKTMKDTSEKTKNIIKNSSKTVKKTTQKKETIDSKNIKTKITKPMSVGKNKTETDKKEEKADNGFLFIVGSIIVLLLIFAYLFVDITQEKSLEEVCLEYQNDPALQFPCKCVPTTREKNESDIVDVKTDGICTCYCDIGNNQTAAIEVRKAIK